MKKIFATCFFLLIFLHSANAQEAIPENFGCFIRYNMQGFRPPELLPRFNGWEGESLPPSYLSRDAGSHIIRVVKGSVKSLPYVFTIQIIKKYKDKPGVVKVNVVNPVTNKSLANFPYRITNTMVNSSIIEDQNIEFEIGVPLTVKNKILESHLKNYPPPLGRVFNVILIIGVGDTFFEAADILRK